MDSSRYPGRTDRRAEAQDAPTDDAGRRQGQRRRRGRGLDLPVRHSRGEYRGVRPRPAAPRGGGRMVLLATRCHAGKAKALGLTTRNAGIHRRLTNAGVLTSPKTRRFLSARTRCNPPEFPIRNALWFRWISAARCIEHDLVVSPKTLEEIQGPTFAFAALHCNSHDRGHGSIAIDGGEQPVLERIDGEDEIGECMRLVDQYGYATRGQTFPDAYRPGQPDRNIIAPTGPGEGERLALVGAIVSVRDEIVRDHGSAKKLGDGVLRPRGQRGEPRGVRTLRQGAALGQIRRPLDPATKRHAAPIEPRIHFRDGIGAILRMKKRIRHRFGSPEIVSAPQHVRDRMVLWQRVERGGETSEIRRR